MPPSAFAKAQTSQIQVLAPKAQLDYFDSRSVKLMRPLTALEAWNTIMAQPVPGLKLAFAVRDTLSSWFGVKKIGGFSNKPKGFVQVGDRLDFFLVEHITDTVLTLTARDKHLDVMTCVTTTDETLTVTSSVKTHNKFGRAYMVPVGPAHKVIVWYMLRRMSKAMAAEALS